MKSPNYFHTKNTLFHFSAHTLGMTCTKLLHHYFLFSEPWPHFIRSIDITSIRCYLLSVVEYVKFEETGLCTSYILYNTLLNHVRKILL